MLIFALILFVITYICMIIFSKYRPYIALGSACIFLISGILPITKIFDYLDLNVIFMICGTMGVVSLVIESKMPSLIADVLLKKVHKVKWLIVILSIFAGVVSAFIDNVATVLMIAPIALALAKKLKINPVPMIIAIAVSSNLQGAATLVGDTTSIMLGSAANMSFNDFFWFQNRPSIFFATELGAVCATLLVILMFRHENETFESDEVTKVEDYVPSFFLLGIVLSLIIVSFVPNKPDLTNGIICMAFLIVALLYKIIKAKNIKSIIPTLKEIDYETIIMLIGIFTVVGGITEVGLIDEIAKFLTKISGGNPFLAYTIIVWFSVLISAFIDNIPYVATMLPVVNSMALGLGMNPICMFFGLLCGATLGGNLTPVGASANIAGIGLLKKEGYEVKNSDFLKIGIPFTLAAIIPAYIFIWLCYGIF